MEESYLLFILVAPPPRRLLVHFLHVASDEIHDPDLGVVVQVANPD